MKRKYFFGILLSLFLLCGGVFLLLYENSNTNINYQQVKNFAEIAKLDIKTYYYVYGYGGKMGVDIKAQHLLCNENGSGEVQKKDYEIKSDDNSQVHRVQPKITQGHENFWGRKGRKLRFINVGTYASGLSDPVMYINPQGTATETKASLANGTTRQYNDTSNDPYSNDCSF